MQSKPIQLFKDSAGALLLALASALCVINITSPVDLVSPLDPIFDVSVRTLFWVVGGVAFLTALVCLFSRPPGFSISILAWLGLNLLVYLIGIYWQGWHGLTGLLTGFSYTFSLAPNIATALIWLLEAALLLSSFGCLLWLCCQGKLEKNLVKMSCPGCGGHIRFVEHNLGQKMPCPHCRQAITLRKPENLRMACFFCKEHIEFPAYAIGEKIPCPHCKMDITLKD